MKPIAIHPMPGTFSERWIASCEERGVPYLLVDALAPDIIERLRGASAFLWHFSHGVASHLTIARHVLFAAEAAGLPVFPSFATCWHFDDKVAQKYLLEAVDAPLIPTWAFFDEAQALEWARTATYPLVFKLKRGSGSRNVRLVRSRAEAEQLVRRAFSRGFRASGTVTQEAWKVANHWRKGSLASFLRSVPTRVARRRRMDATLGRERGYVYFQEFVPDNTHDTRVTIIGERAFAFTRDVRPDDFRASGSGRIVYDHDRIDPACLRIAFDLAARLGTQSLAIDFVRGAQGPLVGEISFGYNAKAVYDVGGYWDPALTFHPGAMWPEDAILADVLARVAAGERA